MRILTSMRYAVTFLLIGSLMPFSILAAGVVALREKRRDERLQANSGSLCSADSECPSGFVCLNGRCVPAS